MFTQPDESLGLRLIEFLKQAEEEAKNKEYLPVGAWREPNGGRGRLHAICNRCADEQPTFKYEGIAAVANCDWCGIANFNNLPEDVQLKMMPAPIFVAKFDNEKDMETLKSIIGKDALEAKFANNPPEVARQMIVDECRKAMAEKEKQ